MTHLDTHVVVCLYAGMTSRLPPSVRQYLNASALAISPMVILELQYLYEIGRTTEAGNVVVADLAQRIGLGLAEEPLPHVITLALQQIWTRDPFERIIVGQAAIQQCRLITKDRAMREHYTDAWWGE